jgi:HSP20 family protein
MLMRPYRGRMSPWREMDRLRRDMNRLYTDWSTEAGRAVAPGYPAMNVWTDQDSAIVTAELPGANLEDIDISVEDDTLTLSGDRQRDELEESVTYHRRERRFGSFLRTFQLPFRVDAAKVDATLKNGVLSISLPRAEEDRPRRITIRAG